MTEIDNGVIVQSMYSFLLGCGMTQNREKFSLPEAGHRGFTVDIGSSYGEVAVRVLDAGVPEVFRITRHTQVESVQNGVARRINERRELIRTVNANTKPIYNSKNEISDRRTPR